MRLAVTRAGLRQELLRTWTRLVTARRLLAPDWPHLAAEARIEAELRAEAEGLEDSSAVASALASGVH